MSRTLPRAARRHVTVQAWLLLAWAGAAAAQASAQDPLYKFVLDYAVPESPGFAVMGVTPEKVLRGSAAKPVVASLLTQARDGGKLASGVAIDLSPYFALGGTAGSVAQYASDPWIRALTNTQLSFATMQSKVDTTSVGFGIGVRITLLDASDPLRDTMALQPVYAALNDCVSAPLPDQPPQVKPGRCDTVAEAFQKVKENAMKRTGLSLSVGGGMGGRLRSAVASQDSLTDRVGRIWIAGGWRFTGHNELQVIAQLQDTTGQRWTGRAGAAARATFPSVEFALELVYDGISRTFQPGGVAEWRVLPGAWVVTSLGTQAAEVNGATVSKLRLHTALRWNPAGAGH
jgi:hypothetical protein